MTYTVYIKNKPLKARFQYIRFNSYTDVILNPNWTIGVIFTDSFITIGLDTYSHNIPDITIRLSN